MFWRLAIIVSLVLQPLFGFAPSSRAASVAFADVADTCCSAFAEPMCCPVTGEEAAACGCFTPAEPNPEPSRTARLVQQSPIAIVATRPSVIWPGVRTWTTPGLSGPQTLRSAPALATLCTWLT